MSIQIYREELLRCALERLGQSIFNHYERECAKSGLQWLPIEHPLASLLHDVRNEARRLGLKLKEQPVARPAEETP
jgi:hypothetical protein